MSTILLPHLPNAVDHVYLRSVAAQAEVVLPLVIGGLVVLLVVALLLFWRMSRKPQAVPPTPAQTPDTTSTPIVVPPPPLPVAISLDFMTESDQHVSFTLDKPILTIGRASDNDIVVTSPMLNADTVSQHHARLRRDQEGYVVRNLGSKNGLAVNGRQTLENLLQDGDRLQFGEAEAIFHQSAGGAA